MDIRRHFMCHESASGSTVMADAAGDVDPDAVTSRSWCIEDPDLIFLIVAHAEFQSLATIARICKSWRAAALRTDLPHWSECDESRFLALQRSILRRYSSEALIRVLRSKPRIGALDLTNLSASEGSSLHRMSAVLPATLHTLAVRPPEGRGRVRIEHPDVFLDALLARIEELPMLRSLDLTGILTERSLAGLRLQQRRRAKTADMREDDLTQGSPNVARLSFARALPRLEVLALGFHCFSVIGQREGLEYARSPLPNSPQPRPCSRPSHHPQPRPLLQTFTPPTASPPAPDVHATHRTRSPCPKRSRAARLCSVTKRANDVRCDDSAARCSCVCVCRASSCFVRYLLEQQRLAPRLCRIGCLVDAPRCAPLDVKCRMCGEVLYRRLEEYIVHPPQQPHISCTCA